jgi:hypothetical protein
LMQQVHRLQNVEFEQTMPGRTQDH